jgi:hypothetical protein
VFDILNCLHVQADIDEQITEQHVRFLNEPCHHIPDRNFVRAMWNDSEHGNTTDGEGEDQEADETSDEDGDGDKDGRIRKTPWVVEPYKITSDESNIDD